ncbi:microsomal dipeptidase precursor [Niveomyces insectorum RCEF 264]|uniref:Dipeptidase n=1 Tax=Niveomyces insectorum RCEF 264 TaxID=1081102 RepID=A0A162MCQ4_9HYPO|nr:microsomal dipeptidase precursor [Niveomyces insectorum RCEF 264]
MAPVLDEKTAYTAVPGHAGADGGWAGEAEKGQTRPPASIKAPRRPWAALTAARVGFLVVLALLVGGHVLYARRGLSCRHHHRQNPPAELTIEERVDKILTSTPLIDGHNDFAIAIRWLFNNHINSPDFRKGFETDGLPQHVDLPRLRAGKNGGAFWSVFTSCPENASDFSDATYAESVRDTLQQIDVVTRLRDAYPDVFSQNVNGSTALAAFERGQLISPLGIEGLHQIGNSAANLRRYHALGVRYATLTHNCPNRYADAALWENPLRKAPRYWNGLSPAGRALVREMNRLGVIVDLSHTSVDTMEDVLGARPDDEAGWHGSVAPVIFSHSSAHSVCPHPRNVPDHVLDLVRQRNGLVMVNFAPDFVSCHWAEEEDDKKDSRGIPAFYPPNSTLAHVATHVLHIGRRIGFAHVGFGSDFDGIASTPAGLDDVAAYPALVAELLRRGVTDAEAAQVVGGNLLRVWADVDAVALALQAQGVPPLEDDLPPVRWE